MKILENTKYADRIRLPLNFDVRRMQQEIASIDLQPFTYYDSIPLRAPAHLVDPSYPFPQPADDYADGSWAEWLDTEFLKNSSYLNSVVSTFKNKTKVTLVRLLRLEPGAIVKEHTDPTLGLEIAKSVIRLTIPIQADEQVQFYLNDELVHMKPGECWYMRLTDPHRVINNSPEERINMTIDMIPNEWVRSMLEQ